ncbi:MAG: hypothetical protein JWR67_2802 [Mucilaginibacter sp.]|nr:hypothetical protein [Mucilaginibacter sp.]
MMGIDRYVDWEQYCWFALTINNVGKKVIEDYKIELDFDGEFQEVGTEQSDVFNYKTFKNNVKTYSNSARSLFIKPDELVLVPSDGFMTKGIYVKPNIGLESIIKLKWKLLSRDFEDNGELIISIVPRYLIEKRTEYLSLELLDEQTEEISLIQRKQSLNPMDGFSDDISDLVFE